MREGIERGERGEREERGESVRDIERGRKESEIYANRQCSMAFPSHYGGDIWRS